MTDEISGIPKHLIETYMPQISATNGRKFSQDLLQLYLELEAFPEAHESFERERAEVEAAYASDPIMSSSAEKRSAADELWKIKFTERYPDYMKALQRCGDFVKSRTPMENQVITNFIADGGTAEQYELLKQAVLNVEFGPPR